MDYGFYNPYLLNKLDTIDAEELMATPYAPKNFIVADMLPEGLTLLCGPSKIGKSWFVLQLCLCVALGKMFLGHNIISSDVLYLALEDISSGWRMCRYTSNAPTRSGAKRFRRDTSMQSPQKATEKEKPSRRENCGRRTDGHLPDISTSCLRMCRMTCPSCKPPP